MKKNLHPKYDPTNITCSSCGTVWPTRSTRAGMRVDICSNCHPFYTGEQRIVDTAGQVDRFMKRLAATNEKQAAAARRKETQQPAPRPSLLKEIYGDDA
jgi:large subunit ribosomal protein L31